jgi:ER degradation enhancer, mannosidase alpha-like 1
VAKSSSSDVLDTLPVLGDHKGFEHAVRNTIDWVSFDVDTKPQVFETNIRVLGGVSHTANISTGPNFSSGLLSAHQFASKGPFKISWYKGELLRMAVDLGERLLPAFNTPTGLPYARVCSFPPRLVAHQLTVFFKLNLRRGVMQGETVETCMSAIDFRIIGFMDDELRYCGRR